ncbi:MAG: hypothetical protein H7061_05825 [Bdellovibrionaceae bacterium]|nr:hypothetical protein [Bdellovibrio sp.]
MSIIKSKLTFLCKPNADLHAFKDYDPLSLSTNDLKNDRHAIDLFVCDASLVTENQTAKLIHQKKLRNEISKVILVGLQDVNLPVENYNLIRPDVVMELSQLTVDRLMILWDEVIQSNQDQIYLNLSAELNSEYEIIKRELERKLQEKTQTLIESRKQIFEINNRVEFLRRTLYVTSKVKNLEEAEKELNALLASYNKVTWLKIVQRADSEKFEADAIPQLESTFFKTEMKLQKEIYFLFFFKGDKKVFRKTDLEYFKKLSETLEINLSRSIDLQSLQQSERLFDLAFHSSPHSILVIDKDYHVLQANLAAEQSPLGSAHKSKCYELLFSRRSPCPGCQLGHNFEVQNEMKTFRVQSSHFSLDNEEESEYYIHLYEDISEQKSMENKFQQTARLAELGLVSSSIAHELNNPLGGILSYLQIMKLDLPNSHPFQADIEMMNQTGLRMKKIIEELLIFSRKEDSFQPESQSLLKLLQKNLDLLQMQLKKENLKVVIADVNSDAQHLVSALHFRNSIHLAFQFFLQKLKMKRLTQANFTGLVEVKIFQDQMNSYLSFQTNLGPYDIMANSNDMTLITLEKSLLDQGFQVVMSEPKPSWIQLLLTLPLAKI